MGRMIGTGSDVVGFLKEQHEDIKEMFGEVLSAEGEGRATVFQALRRLLAVHETAEEEIVHPAARRALPDGDAVVDARLREEKAAKQALAELEKLDVDSPAFLASFENLRKDVIAHAESEERDEFAGLATELDPERLERMRRATEIAEKLAPTRPHPGIESRTENLLAGPFAAMVDRARDALMGKR